MEIHHPHGSHHERKLKDYFFEFFMLFLAVTAGFFMENLREKLVERHKEHQYISSLMRDLQEDTTSIRSIIAENEKQIKGIDSILVLLENPLTDSTTRKLYFQTNTHLNKLQEFTVREVTITQLRNSGGLRLIDNKSVSDSIVYYYGTFESHSEQQTFNYKLLQELMEMQMKLFDFSAFKLKSRKMTFPASETKEFYNRIIVYHAMLRYEVGWLKDYQKSGFSLISVLKKEYNLK